jgi:hypothetical protein
VVDTTVEVVVEEEDEVVVVNDGREIEVSTPITVPVEEVEEDWEEEVEDDEVEVDEEGEKKGLDSPSGDPFKPVSVTGATGWGAAG